MEKLLVIDGNAIIHRSFHAIPQNLRTKDGLLTNAAYGFASFLIKSLSEIKPQYIALCMDKKGPTFRHKLYKEYKGTRVKASQDLYDQIPLAKEIAKAFDISIFELDSYEADDLIGTISKKINDKHQKVEVIIATGDGDALQLINETTKVYQLSRGVSEAILYDTDKVVEKYQITPSQIIDFKAIKGDASDNIPGVAKIGDVGAKQLLQEFQDLDNIYKNIDSHKIKEAHKNALLENKENAYLSQKLATIDLNAPIEIDLNELRINKIDKEKVAHVFSKLEFESLLSRVLDLNFVKQAEKDKLDKFKRNQEKFNYTLIQTDEDFKSFLEKIKKAKEFSFDTETNSEIALYADLLGISFCFKENEAYFLDIKITNPQKNKVKKETMSLFQEENKVSTEHKWIKEISLIMQDKNKLKIAHNLKYDAQVLLNFDIKVQGPIFDTMLASYVLNPENRQHGLDSLSFSELNWEKITYNEVSQGRNLSEIDIEKLGIYSCEDADYTFKLKNKLAEKLKSEKLESVFYDIEMPLIEVLLNMERNGIMLDSPLLLSLNKELEKQIEKLEKEIHEIAGTSFNVRSPKQLKDILFNKLAINTFKIKKTKTGLSTAASELNKLKDLHPIIALIQEYRELSKIQSTYIESLPKLVNQNDSRIHSSFNQSITATGRLSSSDPNLQNIPTRSDLGKKIRRAFVAPSGYKILAIDYSQIELRIMAHLSEDKQLVKAFNNNEDIHKVTAALINNAKLDEVDYTMRYQAKAVNFGIIYGQGPHGLSESANISYHDAKNFIDNYFKSYSGVKKYIENEIKTAEKTGYTKTIFGRKRQISDINSQEIMKKKAAERMIINSPVQGSAADILKIAMIRIFKEIKNDTDIKMLLQVHDELIFEVKDDKVLDYYQKIKKIMEEVLVLKVPLIATGQIADNWGDLEDIKKAL